MSNKTSDKNVANIEDEIMSQEAFNELIDNFEVVATLTMYGRKSIKHYVKEMQAELERKDKRIQELEEEIAMLKKASNIAKEVNIEDVTDVINESCKEFMSNYIPKQAVIDKIKELEESNRIYALNGSNIKLELHIKENYIPVQKVKVKIEELDIAILECEYDDDDVEEYKNDVEKEKRILLIKKSALEELLEEK